MGNHIWLGDGHGPALETKGSVKSPPASGAVIPSAKVRAYLYGVVVAASPVAVIYGLVNAEQAGLWVALGGAVLGATNVLALVNTGAGGTK